MKETWNKIKLIFFFKFLGLNAIILKLVVGNSPFVSKIKTVYKTYMKTKKSLLKSVQLWLYNNQKCKIEMFLKHV